MLSHQEQNKVVSRAEEISNEFLKSIGKSPISIGIQRENSERSHSATSSLTIQCEDFVETNTWELLKKGISFLQKHVAFPFSSNPEATLNELEGLFDNLDRLTEPLDWFYWLVFLLGISQLEVESIWYTAINFPFERDRLSSSDQSIQEQLEKLLVKWRLVARPQSSLNEISSPIGLLLLRVIHAKNIHSKLSLVIERVAIARRREKEEDILKTYLVKELTPSCVAEQQFHDKIFELETNIDDMTGEELGNIIDEFSKQSDVLDVSAYSLLMKKNRPAWCLRILTRHPKIVAERLLERTSTFGVRIQEVSRHIGDRRIRSEEVSVRGKRWMVRVKEKISRDRVVGWKLEYDDLQKIATALAMPLLEVKREVEAQIVARGVRNE